jgi:hypothetical protein
VLEVVAVEETIEEDERLLVCVIGVIWLDDRVE